PTSPSSAGAARFLIEQAYGYPVTVIHTLSLNTADLSRYDVLILPDDSRGRFGYSEFITEIGVSHMRDWVHQGGTLVSVGGAAKWLTNENVGLLGTKTEDRNRKDEDQEIKQEEPKGEEEKAEGESPVQTPGAILRVSLDTDHWLTSGYDSQTNVIVTSNRVFSPLTHDQGQNLAVYAPKEELLLSG
ncbi:MAG: hypothetical protein ACWGQW_12500, partial [bacterium]